MDDLAKSTHPSQSAEGQPGAEAGAQSASPPPPPPPPDGPWIGFDKGFRKRDPGIIERMLIERRDWFGTGDMTTPDSGIYGEFIEAELKAEKDRRDSVHTRAAAAVTSSAGLITLVLGVLGFLIDKHHRFPESAKLFLVAAMACLFCAGACAVAAAFPVGRKFISDSTLEKMLDSHRHDPEKVARDAVACINANILLSLRHTTTLKALAVFASGIFQICAMLCIGIGASIWVHQSPTIMK